MEKHREDMERQQEMLKEMQMRLDAFTSLRQQQSTTEDVGSDEDEEGEYEENEGEDSLGTGEILGEVVDASKGSPPAAAKKRKEKRNINDRIDWTKKKVLLVKLWLTFDRWWSGGGKIIIVIVKTT